MQLPNMAMPEDHYMKIEINEKSFTRRSAEAVKSNQRNNLKNNHFVEMKQRNNPKSNQLAGISCIDNLIEPSFWVREAKEVIHIISVSVLLSPNCLFIINGRKPRKH